MNRSMNMNVKMTILRVLLVAATVMVTCQLGFAVAEKAQLPVDENGRLSENVYVVRSSAPDQWRYSSPVGRRKVIVDDPDLFASDDIVAACLWKGYPVEYIKDSIHTAVEEDDVRQFITDECNHLELGFISYFEDEVLTISWIDPATNEVTDSVSELKPGERNTAWIHTVPSHQFLVKGKSFEEIFTATVPSIFTVGTKPDYTTLGRTITEANKIARIRQELNRVRNIKRVFTDVGFKKVKVPRDVWAEIQTYWYNNRNNRAREEWLDSGFFVNWHEVNQDLVVPPFVMKRRWQEMFQHVIEEWTNTTLEPTDIYGIRTYYDGAWLSNHVDREATHAASAIINVEQVDLQEPWEVHIWDIHGVRHRVSMKPGEALLYESARCMHGRPVPLRGKEYSNIFVHYRPLGKPKWYADPTVGKPGPDITAAFDPKQAETHEIGWVGDIAREKFSQAPISKSEL